MKLLLDIFGAALSCDHVAPPNLSVLHEETVVPAKLDETFEFFSEAKNLERLTPGWLNFQIRSKTPIAMREGTEIDYVIVLHGFPIPWKTRIDVWEPGVRFVDRQLEGPYRWWRHEHRFEAAAGGTRVVDHVEFLPRVSLLTRRWVERDVRRIFKFRQETLKEIFRRQAG